jgi:hypothetical protein
MAGLRDTALLCTDQLVAGGKELEDTQAAGESSAKVMGWLGRASRSGPGLPTPGPPET